ncbi:MAG: DsbA family protein, partial [Chloroflexi bacterium]|nr:DsbA family protein [Chloroflexota bacterium]
METLRHGPAGTSQGATSVLEGTGAYRQGPERATVTIVEFSDYQCPACKALDTTVKRILASNRDRVALVYRNYPLPQHKNAMKAATVAEASGAAGAYWQMHDRLFETQDMWAPMPDPTDYFVTLATGLGIDPQVIRKA